jgi:hypothetical protein
MMGAHFHLISSHRGKSFYINGLLVETHVTNFAGMMMDMSDWRPIRQKFILTICYHASVSLCFFLSFFFFFSVLHCAFQVICIRVFADYSPRV